MEPKNILISGGSGLLGTRLTEILLERGYSVSWLSRNKGKSGNINIYKWDIESGFIEEEAIKEADYIIHLAGASVGGKRWNKGYKKEILESRTKSAGLLFSSVSTLNPNLKAFISASGIAIYGLDRGKELLTEDANKGSDFLAEVSKKWEEAADKFLQLNIRTVKVRIGIVLSAKGGALERLAQPIKLNVGAALGSGSQIMPWIHIDDLCEIFVKAIEDPSLKGVYNGVAPVPVTNKELTHSIAEVLNKKILLPNVPAFVLKIILGEFASSILGGLNVTSEKLQKAGFNFKFKNVRNALINLLARQE